MGGLCGAEAEEPADCLAGLLQPPRLHEVERTLDDEEEKTVHEERHAGAGEGLRLPGCEGAHHIHEQHSPTQHQVEARRQCPPQTHVTRL